MEQMHLQLFKGFNLSHVVNTFTSNSTCWKNIQGAFKCIYSVACAQWNYVAAIHSAVSSYALYFQNDPLVDMLGILKHFVLIPHKIRNWRVGSIIIENQLCQRPWDHLSFGRRFCWCSPLEWKLRYLWTKSISSLSSESYWHDLASSDFHNLQQRLDINS